MDGTTLCGGMTMKGEKCMISSTKMESDERFWVMSSWL